MNWNELSSTELLEQIKFKSPEDKEEILNDYIVAKHEYLEREPLKLKALLEEINRAKVQLADDYEAGTESFESNLNDRVFITIWIARITLDTLNDPERCGQLLDQADRMLQLFEGKYTEELRSENEKNLEELRERLREQTRRIEKQDQAIKMEKGVPLPKALTDYLQLLEKKRVFKKVVNENVGQNHHYGYLFTGNSGTGKRTASKKLFDALKAINPELKNWTETPAIELFDSTNGYAPIGDFLRENRNSLILFTGAESLTMKGLSSQTGIEVLANKLRTEPTITAVLSGPREELIQLVSSCQLAKDIFAYRFHFDDLHPETLTDIAVDYAEGQGYRFTDEARQELLQYFGYEYKMRGPEFQNIHLAHRTVDDTILPALIQRLVDGDTIQSGTDEAVTITVADLPKIRHRDPQKAIEKLESLVGLDNIKKSIMAHASLVYLNRRRMALGLFNHIPPMHMVFTGNPGTGKTTVAELLGEIYYGMGVLSSGHLVEVDRSKLVGQYIGDTEKNTLNAIKSAAGGVLFIDEAYNLFTNDPDRKDYGIRVIETLLTYLSMEQTNMIVVLAGYTAEMENLLQSNPGLKSRFSYIFHFNDYTPEQLMKIGGFVLRKEQYEITPEAEKKLTQYVINAYNNKDEHFGNGRFITRLLTTKIIPAVSDRLYQLPPESLTKKDLVTITEADIPEVTEREKRLNWDGAIIDDALGQLDELAGLTPVKKALHDYVVMLRSSFENKIPMAGSHMLWNFLGNTGTGKSTVAEILCRVMQGAGLLPTNHFTTLNIEEFAGMHNPMAIIEKAMLKSSDGMLFLDLDSPNYRDYETGFLQYWIENKRRELNLNIAVVIARTHDDGDAVARNLVQHGVVPSNHILVFDDFTEDDLKAIFRHLLRKQFGLELAPDAEAVTDRCIGQLYLNRQRFPVNARTMQLLAGTVAQVAQLRIFGDATADPHRVTKADTDKLEWSEDSLLYRKIGF